MRFPTFPKTYKTLSMIMAEFETNCYSSPAYLVLHSAKIRHFYDKNQHAIRQLNEKVAGLNALFVKKDSLGNPKSINVPGKGIQLEFFDDQAAAMYRQEYLEFLEKPCPLHLS